MTISAIGRQAALMEIVDGVAHRLVVTMECAGNGTGCLPIGGGEEHVATTYGKAQ